MPGRRQTHEDLYHAAVRSRRILRRSGNRGRLTSHARPTRSINQIPYQVDILPSPWVKAELFRIFRLPRTAARHDMLNAILQAWANTVERWSRAWLIG
jgi:hypothetical protein